MLEETGTAGSKGEGGTGGEWDNREQTCTKGDGGRQAQPQQRMAASRPETDLRNQRLLQTATQTSWRECPEESRVPGQQCSNAPLATTGAQSTVEGEEMGGVRLDDVGSMGAPEEGLLGRHLLATASGTGTNSMVGFDKGET